MDRGSPRYGQVNLDMMKRWWKLRPEDDGPFWALNLMKYRGVADYEEADYDQQGAGAPAVTGREADDRYAPVDSLRAVGAIVVLWADVAAQTGASPTWDRVGMVRYPSRRAFLEMQRRDDFKRQHVHKSAGMEFTIVTSCLPDPSRPYRPPGDGEQVLRVARVHEGSDLPEPDRGHRVATFDVEGVIVGDERSWSRVALDSVPSGSADSMLERPHGLQPSPGLEQPQGLEQPPGQSPGVEEIFVLRLSLPTVDKLASSLTEACAPRRSPGEELEPHERKETGE